MRKRTFFLQMAAEIAHVQQKELQAQTGRKIFPGML